MGKNKSSYFVHSSAIIEDGVVLNNGVKVWHFCHIRAGARLGDNVSIGKGGYIDKGVSIGNNTRIQNGVSIFEGVIVEDWCFIGPHVVFTNDITPRVGIVDWNIVETKMEKGASLGAGAVIRCGITIGAFAMVGAGAIVTKSIPPFHLYFGHTAKQISKVCACGLTRLPLQTLPKELLRDCCLRRLPSEFFQEAENYIKHMAS